MALVETSNTMGTIKKLKNVFDSIVFIFGIIGMLLFATYYVYLIIKNLSNPLYLVIYSILFFVIVATFIIEIVYRDKKEINRKKRRIIIENKRKFKGLIKLPKYLAKTILVVLAIIETTTNFDLGLSNIFNILLTIWLVIQIFTEIIIYYATEFIDELTMSIRKDFDQSGLIKLKKLFDVKGNIDVVLERTVAYMKEENLQTPKELEKSKKIDKQAKKYRDERKERRDNNIKNNIAELKNITKDKYEEGKEKLKKFFSKENKEDKEA